VEEISIFSAHIGDVVFYILKKETADQLILDVYV
jgi:hypothetical protein